MKETILLIIAIFFSISTLKWMGEFLINKKEADDWLFLICATLCSLTWGAFYYLAYT